MPANTQIQDQDDVLATNERLTTENSRLTTELQAANELLETAQTELNASHASATQAKSESEARKTQADESAAEVARLKTENANLTAKMTDFNKAVAAEVLKLGLNPKAANHKEAPANTDLTPTERVLAAKGVGSIAELNRKE
jgi:chromosome segregation ATPase